MTAPAALLAATFATAEGINPLLPTEGTLLIWTAAALSLALLLWAAMTLLRTPSMPPKQRFTWLVAAAFLPVVGAVLALLAARATRRRAS